MATPRAPVTPSRGEQQAHPWLTWRKDGFTCIAVSDTAAGDLEQLRDLFQKE
jgi:hypothetical protein